MTSSQQPATAVSNRKWLTIIVAIVVLVLAVRLAYRVFPGSVFHVTKVVYKHSFSKCQHMDADSQHCVGIPIHLSCLVVASIVPGKEVPGPVHVRTDDSLYNRPPPSC